MDASFINKLHQVHKNSKNFPSSVQINKILNDLLSILFPAFSTTQYSDEKEIEKQLLLIRNELAEILSFFLPGCTYPIQKR